MATITTPTLKIANIDWVLDRPAQINFDLVNKRTVGTPLYGKWYATVELAPIIGEAAFCPIRSFLFRCNGVANTFRLIATCAPQNANSGVTLSADAAAGDTSVTITGAATSLLDGQMVTLNSQLLQLTADQSESTITFEPPLRAAVTAGAEVETANPYALVRMRTGDISYESSVGQRFDCAFAVEEAMTAEEATDTGGVGDPHFADVVLLVGFEGAYASGANSAFAQDESSYARAGKVNTGTQTALFTSNPKFGAQSARRTIDRQYISYADATEWPNGTNPFTIEMWVLFTASPAADAQDYLIAQYDAGANQRSWAIVMVSGALTLRLSSTGTSVVDKVSTAWAPSTNTWYHVAADFDGTTYRTYVDGVMKGSATGAVSLFNSTAQVALMSALNNGNTNSAYNFQGAIDEVRVTVGTARYASDSGFAVPTAAFPRS